MLKSFNTYYGSGSGGKNSRSGSAELMTITMEDIAITIRYLDQDDDLEAEEKLNELELDIEDNVERTARAQDKIASVSRTMAHIRYTMNVGIFRSKIYSAW